MTLERAEEAACNAVVSQAEHALPKGAGGETRSAWLEQENADLRAKLEVTKKIATSALRQGQHLKEMEKLYKEACTAKLEAAEAELKAAKAQIASLEAERDRNQWLLHSYKERMEEVVSIVTESRPAMQLLQKNLMRQQEKIGALQGNLAVTEGADIAREVPGIPRESYAGIVKKISDPLLLKLEAKAARRDARLQKLTDEGFLTRKNRTWFMRHMSESFDEDE